MGMRTTGCFVTVRQVDCHKTSLGPASSPNNVDLFITDSLADYLDYSIGNSTLGQYSLECRQKSGLSIRNLHNFR